MWRHRAGVAIFRGSDIELAELTVGRIAGLISAVCIVSRQSPLPPALSNSMRRRGVHFPLIPD